MEKANEIQSSECAVYSNGNSDFVAIFFGIPCDKNAISDGHFSFCYFEQYCRFMCHLTGVIEEAFETQ